MIRLITKLLLITLSVFVFTSCDKEHSKEYYVQNKLDKEILIEFSIEEESKSVIIEVDSTKLIYSDIYYFGTVGVSDERDNDKISNISIKYDSIQKTIDEEIWDYDEQGKYFAKYFIKIDTSIIK